MDDDIIPVQRTQVEVITRNWGVYIMIAVVTAVLMYVWLGSDNQINIDTGAGVLIMAGILILAAVYYWEKNKPKQHTWIGIEDGLSFIMNHRYGDKSPLANISETNIRVLPVDFPSCNYYCIHYEDTDYNVLWGVQEGFMGVINRGPVHRAVDALHETGLARMMGREAAHQLLEKRRVLDIAKSQSLQTM